MRFDIEGHTQMTDYHNYIKRTSFMIKKIIKTINKIVANEGKTTIDPSHNRFVYDAVLVKRDK